MGSAALLTVIWRMPRSSAEYLLSREFCVSGHDVYDVFHHTWVFTKTGFKLFPGREWWRAIRFKAHCAWHQLGCWYTCLLMIFASAPESGFMVVDGYGGVRAEICFGSWCGCGYLVKDNVFLVRYLWCNGWDVADLLFTWLADLFEIASLLAVVTGGITSLAATGMWHSVFTASSHFNGAAFSLGVRQSLVVVVVDFLQCFDVHWIVCGKLVFFHEFNFTLS